MSQPESGRRFTSQNRPATYRTLRASTRTNRQTQYKSEIHLSVITSWQTRAGLVAQANFEPRGPAIGTSAPDEAMTFQLLQSFSATRLHTRLERRRVGFAAKRAIVAPSARRPPRHTE